MWMQLVKRHHNEAAVTRSSAQAHRNIAGALAVASCAALTVAAPSLHAQGEPGEWDFEVANLLYAESDSRVNAIEPVFSATRNFDEGESLNLKAVFDVLTGASPSGATPSDEVQTFTRPSGSSSYDVEANQAPLDDTFKDTRIALSANWASPLDHNWDYSAGVYGSKEYDYLSMGVNAGLTRYTNQKNTAFNMGASIEMDSIDPVGGARTPFSLMVAGGEEGAGSDDKAILDLLFGVSQVLGRGTIMQFNYGISYSDGYLNDPYKILSVIDDAAGANYGGNYADASGNNIYLYENRPDSRLKHSLYWQLKHSLDSGDIVDASYRFMIDDWGITSHTLEAAYQWGFNQSYIEPHLRYYQQSEADFYRRYIASGDYNDGDFTFTEASSDSRLGDLTGITIGAKYGWSMGSGNQANVRLDYYVQSNDGDSGFGKLASQELYPDLGAVMMTFGYSF
jgi:Protein of unknown function (DUF3570)